MPLTNLSDVVQFLDLQSFVAIEIVDRETATELASSIEERFLAWWRQQFRQVWRFACYQGVLEVKWTVRAEKAEPGETDVVTRAEAEEQAVSRNRTDEWLRRHPL